MHYFIFLDSLVTCDIVTEYDTSHYAQLPLSRKAHNSVLIS